MSVRCPNLLRANEIERREGALRHPWDPNARAVGTRLGEALGLLRTGVSVARVPPGAESFAYHAHHNEEEWLYILSGCGVAEIDGDELAVGPGDFLAFPAPSVAHNLRNPFDYDLVYLMGGERLACEIEDFPHLGKRILRSHGEVTVYDLADGHPLVPSGTEADGGASRAGRGDAA